MKLTYLISIVAFVVVLVAVALLFEQASAPASSFILAKNFSLGNSSLTANIKILNSTISVYSFNFSSNRPLFNMTDYTNTNRAFNQTISGGNGQWIVITSTQPSLTGPATSQYISGNKTLKITGTANGIVKLTWP